jgi:proteasome lid subunit RPN8/RPN11
MIKIPASLLREIYDHTEASYPNECCGVMIGTTDTQKNHTVHAFRACKNLNRERARDRYDMDPLDMLRAEREDVVAEVRMEVWDIIGIYHSHPDHPSRPSQTDTDRAWADYSYVIISVQQGTVASAQSWVLNESEKKFYEEPLLSEGDSK